MDDDIFYRIYKKVVVAYWSYKPDIYRKGVRKTSVRLADNKAEVRKEHLPIQV
jgi:hypothetical protein